MRPWPSTSVASAVIAYDCMYPATTGGGERQYRDFAETLQRQGVAVTYLTADHGARAFAAMPFPATAVTGRLRLYRRDGVRSTSAAVRFAWGLYRHLRKVDVDMAWISGLPVLNVFAARAALRGRRTRLVVDYLEVWGRKQWIAYSGLLTGTLAWVAQRLALRMTPVATCHSALSANRATAEGARGPVIQSVGLVDGSAEPKALGEPSHEPYVLFAGRHIADKQAHLLPEAVRLLRLRYPSMRLIMTGSGPATGEIMAAIDDAEASSWTSMVGFVDEAELDQLMAGATVLAHPSRREGYGLVVVESAAFGTPVVLVNHPDNAAVELIEEGVNGHLANASSAEALAAAIEKVVEDGSALRTSTYAWAQRARTERSTEATALAVLNYLSAPTVMIDLTFLHARSGGMATYVRELEPHLERELAGVNVTTLVTRRGAGELTGQWRVHSRTVSAPGGTRLGWLWAEVFLVPRWARRLHSDLVWCPANLGPLGSSPRRVTTVHDAIYHTTRRRGPRRLVAWITAKLIARAARESELVITVSESSAKEISAHMDVFPDRLRVIPNGASPVLEAKDGPVSELAQRLRAGRPLMLSIGNRLPHKNFSGLLRALAAMEKAHRPFLVVTGSSSHDPLEPLVRELDLTEDVLLASWVPDTELEALFAAADVYACPSLSEGFGIPVVDAMARDCVVAAHDCAVLREVGGEAAVYGDATDPVAFAAALTEAFDSEKRAVRIHLGRARADTFTWAESARRTAAVLASAVSLGTSR